MSCERCDELLLDLALGELAPDAAESVREHTRACERCATALARLERGAGLAAHLALEEPPPELHARVLDAVRRAESRRGDAGPEGAEGRSWWALLSGWLGELTLGPQVAMATLMMLVVAIGLWHLPSMRRDEGERAGSTLASPDYGGEAAPSASSLGRGSRRAEEPDRVAAGAPQSAAATPGSERAELALESARGARPARAEGRAASPVPVAPAEAAPTGSRLAFREEQGDRAASPLGGVGPSAASGADSLAPRAARPAPEGNAPPRSDLRRAPEPGELLADGLDDGRGRAGSHAYATPPPAPPAAAPAQADVPPSAEASTSRSGYASPPPARARTEARAPRVGSGAGGGSTQAAVYEREADEEAAPAAPRTSGTTAPASVEPSLGVASQPGRASGPPARAPSVGGSRAQASAQAQSGGGALAEARRLRALGRCGEAVPLYEQVLAGGVGGAVPPEALLEASGCYRAIGRTSDARRWLERARQVPATARRATQALGELGASQRPADQRAPE